MSDEKLKLLVGNRLHYQLVELYSPADIADKLTFENGLRVAYRLLYNDDWNDTLQNYAVKLLEELRQVYPVEWQASWKYDALLGLACEITSQHESRYEAYKKAFEKCKHPPPRLLIELARCCVCPGDPSIDYDHAIDLVMQALKDGAYSDGIGLLSTIYSLKKDEAKQKYWIKVLNELPNKEEMSSPSIDPEFLLKEYIQECEEKEKAKKMPEKISDNHS